MAKKAEKTDEKQTKSAPESAPKAEKVTAVSPKVERISESENLAEKIDNIKSITTVLAIALVVMFLWLGWVTARIHHIDDGGYYMHDQMMERSWQNDGRYNDSGNWQFR